MQISGRNTPEQFPILAVSSEMNPSLYTSLGTHIFFQKFIIEPLLIDG